MRRRPSTLERETVLQTVQVGDLEGLEEAELVKLATRVGARPLPPHRTTPHQQLAILQTLK